MRQRPAVTFVILAGGKGERLWPLVRADWPKVCLSLDGAKSLLATTIDRLRPVWPQAQWMVVTTEGQASAVRRCLPRSLRRDVLVEPEPKNTAACVTLAAAAIARRDPQRVLVVAPADQWIGHLEAYRRTVRAAIAAAGRHDTIVTIGLRPTHPHPGLGYLCAGAPLAAGRGVGSSRIFRLARCVEKPSETMRRRLLRHPRTYWNTGTFVGTADMFLTSVTEHLPDHVRRLLPVAQWVGTSGFPRRARTAYRGLPAVSFDHGVMDHLHDGIVIEGRFTWADVGSWDMWARLQAGPSRTLTVDSRNVTVVTPDHHLVATVGVRNLVVVTTPSATLICSPDRAQAVRDIVKRLARDPRLAAYQ